MEKPMKTSDINWDIRFLEIAELVSHWSKDPSTQVGAAVIDPDRRVVSLGYNGFPKGICDDERLNKRQTKYKIVVHAECNALLFADRPLTQCTMYTFPFMPCPTCAGLIIQSGITRVVTYENKIWRWQEEFDVSRAMFKEAGTKLDELLC
jgi:dCMP deaminase